MNEELNKALDRIPDRYIQDAATYKKRRLPRYFGAIAAALALVILIAALNPLPNGPADGTQPGTTGQPALDSRLLLAAPQYPKMAPFRDIAQEGREEWYESMEAQYDQPEGYAQGLEAFFLRGIPEFLAAADSENAVCSPVNIYMALAMLAECTAGNSRQQILDLMGVASIEALRQQAVHVWNAHYRDDGLVKLVLANSLWLDQGYRFNQETVNTLAEVYFASVFQGDLGSEEVNQTLRAWINRQTGGLLQDQAAQLVLDPRTVLALATTIEYRVDWANKFREQDNTQAPFHGPSGESTATYMNQTLFDTYYWAENYCAVGLPLQDNGTMWLILPDQGTTPEELLADGSAVALTMGDREATDHARIRINLSLPKFDVTAAGDLAGAVQKLGVTDVFRQGIGDFTPIVPEHGQALFVGKLDHAARVTIDKDGVTAVAYTVMQMASNSEPPKDEVDLVLDRPFLFVITSQDGLPLFTGVVNEIG